MRLKENLTLRKIADEYIAILTVDGVADYTQAVALNETAAYLLQETLTNEFSAEDWVKLLTDRYEISEEQASLDIDNLLKDLREIGIIA